MRRVIVAIAGVATAGLIVAACGGGNSATSMGGHEKNAPVHAGAREITVNATSFAFSPGEITLRPEEEVTIVLQSQRLFHDFVVQGKGHAVGANAGKTEKGGLRIDKPGTYKFWCSVSGHRSAGMEGTLVVQ
jgi:plastocyanin